jgi:hypothetical protein
MSAAPSLVYLAFAVRDDRRFRGWSAFRDALDAGIPVGATVPVVARRVSDRSSASVRGAAPGVVELSDVGIWRLLASNNRELARGWTAHTSFDEARDDVARLQSSVAALEVAVVRGETASQNGWVATLDGVPVISCGRWFGAASTSMHSARTALAEFAVADFPAAPATVTDRRGRALSGAGPLW